VDSDFWSWQLLRAIDAVTKTTFANVAHHIGFKSKGYTSRLPEYYHLVVALIQDQRADHPLRDGAIAKLKWILFRPSATPRFPIMTGFVIESIVESWNQVAGAVKEVRTVCRTCSIEDLRPRLSADVRSRTCGHGCPQMFDRGPAVIVARRCSIEDLRPQSSTDAID
jgi:ribosomal protein L40E